MFSDPIPGNSAPDRLANSSYQIVVEDTTYRERLSPHRRKEDQKEALTEWIRYHRDLSAGWGRGM